MSLSDTLTKQAGPLPIGAWILVIGGGLGIAFYTTRNSPPAQEQVNTGTDPGVGVGPGTPGFIPVSPPVTGGETFTDNDSWASAAVRYLTGANYSPTAASIAIRKYVDGGSWSAAEDTMIKAAIKQLGPPPLIPIGGGVISTTPIPPTTTTTPKGIYITVNRRNPSTATLIGMAKRFLGAQAAWGYIYVANRQGTRLPDGSLGKVPVSAQLQDGWKIWIPGGVYAPPPKGG